MKKAIITAIAGILISASTVMAQHVGQVDAGAYMGEWQYAGNVVGYSPRSIWVDIWVHNLGYHKEVGILWTDNDWYTANWADAGYEFSYADGAEQWGVDIDPIGKFGWHRSGAHSWFELGGYGQTIGSNGKEIEYVVYYNDISNGNMYWDNNGGQNYRISVVNPGVNGYTQL